MYDYEIKKEVEKVIKDSTETKRLFEEFHRKRDLTLTDDEILDIHERTILILSNQKLIYYVIARYYSSFRDTEDLFSCGKIGLVRAVDDFDETITHSFASFAVPYIRNTIKNEYINPLNKKSHVPDSLISYLSDTLQSTADEDNELTEEDKLVDDYDFIEKVLTKIECEKIYRMFVYLSPVEQQSIAYSYGLFGLERLKPADIAIKIGKCRTRYINALERGLRKLRILLKDKNTMDNQDFQIYLKVIETKYQLIDELKQYSFVVRK